MTACTTGGSAAGGALGGDADGWPATTGRQTPRGAPGGIRQIAAVFHYVRRCMINECAMYYVRVCLLVWRAPPANVAKGWVSKAFVIAL